MKMPFSDKAYYRQQIAELDAMEDDDYRKNNPNKIPLDDKRPFRDD